MNTPISIVTVNWRSKKFLLGMLDSLQAQDYRPLDVIVVNNSSEDELALEKYSQQGLSVRVIDPHANLGFAGGTNLGIKAATAPYIMMLNPDTLVPVGSLAILIGAMDADPTIDVALPKIMLGKDTDLFDRSWDGYSRWGLALTIGYQERDVGQFDDRTDVFGARGAACLFRRSFFTDIGYLDEDLFAFYEDADLNLRGQSQGKRFVFVPASRIIHFGNATTGSLHNPTVDRLSARNKILVFVKNMPGFLLFWHGWRLLLLLCAQAVQHTFIIHDAKAFFSGIVDAIKLLPKFIAKRREVQAKRSVGIWDLNNRLRQSERDFSASLRRLREQQKTQKPWFFLIHK